MDTTTLICLAIILAILLACVVAFYFNSKINLLQSDKAHLHNQNVSLQAQLNDTQKQHNELKFEMELLEKRFISVSTELKFTQDNLATEKANDSRVLERFENLAQKVLSHKAESFSVQQAKDMKHLLSPLEATIKRFEQKVEYTNHEAQKRHISLKEQIQFLGIQSQKVSNDANNLAKALKGDYKQQGNWGELILESILEKSGLEKDREYFIQNSFRDEVGKIKRPDVIIHMPDGKRLIIDSKVSLVDYDRFCGAEDKDAANFSLKKHVQAIRNHITSLSSKNYHQIYQTESPDFVLMFVPIDTAFSAAQTNDPSIYQFGFDKNIIIVTPATLLATLKTVESLWQHDKQNKHALKIAEEAGKMYDKLVAFLDDMNKIGNQLKTVMNTYDGSIKKLSEGKGNLIKRADNIRLLGAKTSRVIS